MMLQERVAEAQRNGKMEMKDVSDKNKKGIKRKSGEDDDTEEASGVRKRLRGKLKGKPKKRFRKKHKKK